MKEQPPTGGRMMDNEMADMEGPYDRYKPPHPVRMNPNEYDRFQ
jgi:hypothetical protein